MENDEKDVEGKSRMRKGRRRKGKMRERNKTTKRTGIRGEKRK